MKISAKVVVMTTPDLQHFHLKRSIVDKTIDYVYMFHYPLSTTMVLRKGALDYYDTVFCVGEFQFDEIRQTEKLYSLPKKKLVLCGYGFLEQLQKAYDNGVRSESNSPKILIAPSWNEGNILDTCICDLLENLLGRGYAVTVRPHPEYMKRFGARLTEIANQFTHYAGDDLQFELDFSSSTSLFESDLVISDWSGAAYEFAYVTKKPVILIDTKMKVHNAEFNLIEAKPLEIELRDQIGVRADPAELGEIAQTVASLLAQKDSYRETITAIRDRYIANFGHSGEIGGDYLIQRIKAWETEKEDQFSLNPSHTHPNR